MNPFYVKHASQDSLGWLNIAVPNLNVPSITNSVTSHVETDAALDENISLAIHGNIGRATGIGIIRRVV